jgi:tetratricopeptide (TPR) repeat protein
MRTTNGKTEAESDNHMIEAEKFLSDANIETAIRHMVAASRSNIPVIRKSEIINKILDVHNNQDIASKALVLFAKLLLDSPGDHDSGIKIIKLCIDTFPNDYDAYELQLTYAHDKFEKLDILAQFSQLSDLTWSQHKLIGKPYVSRPYIISHYLFMILGDHYFNIKEFGLSLHHFDIAHNLNPEAMDVLANSIYLRLSMANWGKDGSQYEKDIKGLLAVIEYENRTKYKLKNSIGIVDPL